jgi:hypothetical protein
MANVEIAILSIAVIALLTALVVQVTPGVPRRRARVLVGLIPGALGAFVILTQHADLVPDDFETWVLPIVILAVSGVMAAITIRGLAKR